MNLDEAKQLNDSYHMNTYGRLPITFVKGKGTRLWDDTGKEYLDLLSGIGVVSVGHCHPAVVDAVKAQVEQLMHVSNLFYTEPQLKLAKKIAEVSFGDKCFFANSGAEANEGAIKLARRYARIHGKDDAYEIVTALNSFHGRTMKTLAATGQLDKQKPFEPMPPGFIHVPLNDIEALKNAVSEKTCAVMLEPIQGEGGVYPCEPQYLKDVRALCDKHDILLIFDEVQTGMGRTGHIFAYQAYGVTPDVMTLAKGIGSGLPIGVLVASDKAAAFSPGEHGSTFGGGPVVCAGALATIQVLEDENLVENSRIVGAYFKEKLENLMKTTGKITEIRGMGLMLAIELSQENSKDIVLKLLKNGIVANSIGNSTVRFLPPLCLKKAEVDQVISKLERLL
ncbi:MAG TPA: acetylornithine transaminase [Candidatus Aquicultor sp.]|jgi:predicted acetylornithine/succinylornithine family transaminase